MFLDMEKYKQKKRLWCWTSHLQWGKAIPNIQTNIDSNRNAKNKAIDKDYSKQFA